MKFQFKETWSCTIDQITVEIVCFAKDNPYIRNGNGIWNYYFYLHEVNWPCIFPDWWLEDLISDYGKVYHHYNHLDVCEFHGGITYYSKHGTMEGHRCVQIGCDFNHLWDEGVEYDFEHVKRIALNSHTLLLNHLKSLCEK